MNIFISLDQYSGNSGRDASAALISFCAKDLVVESAQGHTKVGPCVKVVCSCHSSARTLLLTHRHKLNEVRGALDRGRVVLGVFINIISSAIAVHCAHVRAVVTRVEIVGVQLHDVILVQRIGGPAVDAQASLTSDVPLTRVECDVPAVALIIAVVFHFEALT